MRSSIKAECGHRERKAKIEDGECRDCRGVGKLKRPAPNAPTWNDSGEARDHREAHNRQRIIQNDR